LCAQEFLDPVEQSEQFLVVMIHDDMSCGGKPPLATDSLRHNVSHPCHLWLSAPAI
jgi:hypothetical protein